MNPPSHLSRHLPQSMGHQSLSMSPWLPCRRSLDFPPSRQRHNLLTPVCTHVYKMIPYIQNLAIAGLPPSKKRRIKPKVTARKSTSFGERVREPRNYAVRVTFATSHCLNRNCLTISLPHSQAHFPPAPTPSVSVPAKPKPALKRKPGPKLKPARFVSCGGCNEFFCVMMTFGSHRSTCLTMTRLKARLNSLQLLSSQCSS